MLLTRLWAVSPSGRTLLTVTLSSVLGGTVAISVEDGSNQES
jgi:hypothetical protein